MQTHCRRLAALVLRRSNSVVTSKPPHPHLPPHHPLRPRRLDAAVVRTSTSLRRRRFDTAATGSTQQLSGCHDAAFSSRPLPPPRPPRHDHDHYLDRHNAAAAATSTALTRPRPNTTPFPLVTTSSAPPPTSATSTGTPAPPRQARDGATYTGAVSTRPLLPRRRRSDKFSIFSFFFSFSSQLVQDSATAAAPTWSPPPLRSATTPTNTARLNHAHRRRPDSALTATPCAHPATTRRPATHAPPRRHCHLNTIATPPPCRCGIWLP
ncbi:hypothetical protein EDB84DRAFT_1584426 [Lactarius hengduanensis]|nr:hypothetical protein EDB84DRAFT_1584426 [Lactarius hengduanensis]